MNNETRQAWTPQISAGTPGDLSVVYTVQQGVWAQAGSIVVLGCSLQFVPTYTSASGLILITGVPLAITPPATDFGLWGGGMGSISNWTWPTGNTQLVGLFQGLPASGGPSGRLTLSGNGSGATSTSVRITDLPTGSNNRIQLSMTYALPGG